jgi:phage terminase large subunit-like protein
MAGRPRLSAEEKARRGTLKPSRERAYAEPDHVSAPPAEFLVPARDYAGIAARYMADVLSGRETACVWVRLAVERQLRDLERGDGWDHIWNQEMGGAACRFVESCPHVEGRWATPLITLEPFQVFLVMLLYGWRVRLDISRRRFTTLYLEVGRKAAKSTLAAALALLHLLREGEPGASVVCGATTGSQARMVFGIMQKMIRRSAWLKAHGMVALANAILAPDGDAKPVNSKATTLDGLNPSCIILDESHAQDFGLHDVLKSAQGARTNPLLMCPTTAGYDLLSVGYALRGQVTKVLQRVYEADHLLGIIYTLDENDDWRDPRVWRKANPMLGVSPKLEWVAKYCADAQQAPGLEGEFKVKVCCIWAASARAWLSMSAWDRCADSTLTLERFNGQRCWMGGDLAQLDDLAALAFLFEAPAGWLAAERQAGRLLDEKGKPLPITADVLVAFVRAYLPEGVVELRARLVPAYREWLNTGLLVPTEGNMTDVDRIEKDIRAACKQFQVQAGVFDQFGSAQLVSRLAADGLPFSVAPKNSRTATPPARDLEARVTHKQLRHDGNSLLKWAASNAVVQRRTDDSLLPKKETVDSPNKIDPLDAVLWAMLGRLTATSRQREYQLLVVGGGR